jgi:hypothetical protein
MGPPIAPYVSALSVMLAAYGFFYNAFRGRVEAGKEIGAPAASLTPWNTQVKKVRQARSAARVLGLVPLLVWAIFLKPVVDQIDAGIEAGFALDHYSALDVVFVVLANAWLLVAVISLLDAKSLSTKKSQLEQAKPTSAG